MSASSVPSPSDNPRPVLDTWPVMEWLKDRNCAADYFDLLLAKAWGVARADTVMERLHELPIHLISVSDASVLQAARLKITNKISYADAFAVGLAMELCCPLVTGIRSFSPS
jgi:predicted nucleic acid-binding protein